MTPLIKQNDGNLEVGLLNSPGTDFLTEVKVIQFGDIIVDKLAVQFLLDKS